MFQSTLSRSVPDTPTGNIPETSRPSEEHQRRRVTAHHQRSPQSEAPNIPSSSNGQNDVDDEEEESFGDGHILPNLAEDQLAVLNSLLTKPGREKYTTVLSQEPKPNTTWFGRDKSSLARKITQIICKKFNGPYYSWKCVPQDRRERYFVAFAARHTWDPLITGLVQEEFEKVCKRRIKDMVSTAKASGEKPPWIDETVWLVMNKHWETAEAKKKSSTTSAARMSERGGLGPSVHYCGQKSYLQIQQEMEFEFKRPVSLGEVFIRTHTKKDGTYVDHKAKTVAENYNKNLAAKEQLLVDAAQENSDVTSKNRSLSIDEKNDIFLQSTFINERGTPYGIGSLADSIITGKRKFPESFASYTSLQDQLTEAHRQIEKQAAESARREAEMVKVTSAQQAKIDQLSMVEKFLKETDPRFKDFVASQPRAPPTNTSDPSPSTIPTNLEQ